MWRERSSYAPLPQSATARTEANRRLPVGACGRRLPASDTPTAGIARRLSAPPLRPQASALSRDAFQMTPSQHPGQVHSVRMARVAGLLYLVVIVGAGFAQGAVREGLVVWGDAEATARSIGGALDLFRLGLVGDLLAFMADTALAVLFYLMLRPVDRALALVAAAFRLVAHPAIAAVNLLNHWLGGVFAAPPEYLSPFTPEQLQGLALLAMDVHRQGYLLAGAFFGVHLVLLGWLMVRSTGFPRWLGILVSVAGVAYLAETFAHFGFPAAAGIATLAVVVAASVAELTLCVWLLARGVRRAG